MNLVTNKDTAMAVRAYTIT